MMELIYSANGRECEIRFRTSFGESAGCQFNWHAKVHGFDLRGVIYSQNRIDSTTRNELFQACFGKL